MYCIHAKRIIDVFTTLIEMHSHITHEHMNGIFILRVHTMRRSMLLYLKHRKRTYKTVIKGSFVTFSLKKKNHVDKRNHHDLPRCCYSNYTRAHKQMYHVCVRKNKYISFKYSCES